MSWEHWLLIGLAVGHLGNFAVIIVGHFMAYDSDPEDFLIPSLFLLVPGVLLCLAIVMVFFVVVDQSRYKIAAYKRRRQLKDADKEEP